MGFKNKIAVFVLIAGWPAVFFSQDAQISQYEAFPLYINPALTGHTYQNRFALLSRMQWVNIEGAYRTFGFSYDFNLNKINSGFGLLAMQDETSAGALASTSAGGLYSYHLRIKNQLFFNSGTRVSYLQQRLMAEKLVFADQLIRNDGSPTVEVFENLNHNFLDIGWGALIFFHDSIKVRNFTVGLAIDHLNVPDNSFMEEKSRLPVKFTVHASGLYRLAKDMKNYPKHLVHFSFLYKRQLKWEQAEAGMSYILSLPDPQKPLEGNARKKIIIAVPKFGEISGIPLNPATKNEMQMPSVYLQAGVFYRGIPTAKKNQYGYINQDAVVFLFGVNYHKFRIAYTYDLTISKLGLSGSGGSHELSLTYKFPR